MAQAAGLGRRRRFRSLLWRPALDDEIADELAFHLEMRARDYAARGLAPAAAAAAARRRFGDPGEVEAACRAIGRGRDRAQRRGLWLSESLRDLRLAGRRLGDQPGSTLLAALALAVGLAGAATSWRVARAVLRPPPFAEPDRVVRLRQLNPQGAEFAVTPLVYDDWRRLSRSFALTAAYEAVEANLQSDAAAPAPDRPEDRLDHPPGRLADDLVPDLRDAGPERVLAVRATASLLPLLGVRPWLGRGFSVAEAARGGDRRVAVLSYALWRRRFGADPRAVGRTLSLDGEPMTILGVMPAGVEAPPGAGLWLPLAVHGPLRGASRDHHRLEVLARLRPEVAPARAAAGMTAVAAEVARRHPETDKGWKVRLETLPAAWTGERWTRRARLLLAAAALLWLLASATAANLLWARSTARQRELDLRAVLGGGRGRIVRQLFAEGLLLALLGAAGGLLLAGGATGALRVAAAGLPQLAGLGGPVSPAAGDLAAASPAALAALPRLDAGSAGLVLALALLSGLACGLGPALQATRPGPHQLARRSARSTTRGERWTRDALVVLELAVATTLLVAAGLLAESYLRLDRADPGFEADHVLSVRLALNGDRYPSRQRRALLRRLESRLGRLAGVEAAGFTSTAPLPAERPNDPFTLERQPRREFLSAEWRVVTPGLFRALGLRRTAGRLLGPADGAAGPPPAVIDATLAERCWPGASPLGRTLRWEAGARDLTVIGVVDRVRDLDLEADPAGAVFLPYEALPWRSMELVVRPAAGSPGDGELAATLRREIAALDPGLAVGPPRRLEVARRQAVAAPRLGSWLVALFAAAALGLAVSGVYATAASAVARRTPEIAVRQALGAAGGDVLRLILGRGARLTLLGLALGAGGALLFGRLLAGLLYETPVLHLPAYALAALLLGGAATLASVVPARRAARIAPILALRRE
jgi:putative ABC transport system permease protein